MVGLGIAVTATAIGLLLAYGPRSTVLSPNGDRPASTGPRPTALVHLYGNGIRATRFGQTQSSAISSLDKTFGSPNSTAPINMAGDCTVDAAVQWPTITAYFKNGRFVGYSTLSATGEKLPTTHLATVKGLHVGDTLSTANRIYGSAFGTSLAQGGSWFVTTPNGQLDGYLSTEPNQHTGRVLISSIEAGAVGCPAASP